ncbi:MAG: tetratricopeptide repeat protein [Bdellovibrionaceae bacterium]|nr:tetratricopeptide repeat protein [Pseudobdellovibrionaceae bacterium]
MFRILIFTAVTTLLCSSCATGTKDRQRAEFLLRSGTSSLTAGHYASALRDLLAAEQLDPKNAIVQNNLGLTYFMREKYDLAEKHIAQAITLVPSYTEARNNRGRVLIELSRYDEALQELEKVLQDLTYEQPEKAWFNIGLVHFRRGQFRTAKEKFAETIRMNRQHCLGHTYFGRTLLELGEFDRAATSLDSAISLCKENAPKDEAHYYSGLSYFKLGRTDKAVARMEEVIRLYPEGKFAGKAESMLQIMLK